MAVTLVVIDGSEWPRISATTGMSMPRRVAAGGGGHRPRSAASRAPRAPAAVGSGELRATAVDAVHPRLRGWQLPRRRVREVHGQDHRDEDDHSYDDGPTAPGRLPWVPHHTYPEACQDLVASSLVRSIMRANGPQVPAHAFENDDEVPRILRRLCDVKCQSNRKLTAACCHECSEHPVLTLVRWCTSTSCGHARRRPRQREN